MKIYYIIVMYVILVVCSGTAGVASTTQFFQGLPDIPVAAGVRPLPEGAIVFEKPGGRIVQLICTIDTPNSETEILDFYRQALPAFGWVPRSTHSYNRDGETLSFVFRTENRQTYMDISVSP